MEPFPTSMVPLDGGFSGETFLAEAAGEEVVVRIYGGRSLARGPAAPEIDAAVLELVGGLLPVPRVLEVRAGDVEEERPGLLVTARLPGQRLDLVLPVLRTEQVVAAGESLGVLLGRLGHLAQPRGGFFSGRDLVLEPMPRQAQDLSAWVEHHEASLGLEPGELAALLAVTESAQDLLETGDRRFCLVHGDLNPKNVLVDPSTLEITGLVDWEYCHAGSAYADLGNLLRFDRDPALAEAVLGSYRDFMPATPEDLLDRARASDLFALVDLAGRRGQSPVADLAHAQLLGIARTGDLHYLAPRPGP